MIWNIINHNSHYSNSWKRESEKNNEDKIEIYKRETDDRSSSIEYKNKHRFNTITNKIIKRIFNKSTKYS